MRRAAHRKYSLSSREPPNTQAMPNTHVHSNTLASKEKSKGNVLSISFSLLIKALHMCSNPPLLPPPCTEY